MLFIEDVPGGAAINEAVELTKKYSDDKSSSFINGVLDKILKTTLEGPFSCDILCVDNKVSMAGNICCTKEKCSVMQP